MIKKSIVFAAFDEEYVATIEFKLAKLTEERASIEFITDAGCLEAFLERPKKIGLCYRIQRLFRRQAFTI